MLGIKEKIEPALEENPVYSEVVSEKKSEEKFEHLIIPKTVTAKNQLEAVFKKERQHLSLTWRGGTKLPTGKWPNPSTMGYSVAEEKKGALLKILEKAGIPITEIEFRKIPPLLVVPEHVRSANRIAEWGDRYAELLQVMIEKEKEEIGRAKDLFDNDDISAAEFVERKQEIIKRYAIEKQHLEEQKNRNYQAANDIYDEGAARNLSADSFLVEAGKTHLAAQKGKDILSHHKYGIFQRMGQVVRIVRYVKTPSSEKSVIKRSEGGFFISEVDAIFLVKRLSEEASWCRFDKRTKRNEPIDFPEKAARFILSDHGSSFPVLTGFICCPTLRTDGSILEVPGYDPESGLFFDSYGTFFSSVPQAPTREDALNSLALLKDLLKDFIFDGETSSSVAIAELMTSVVRRSLRYSPAFGNNAPEAGSGKSLLGDIASILGTGNRCTCISPSTSEEENRKRFASALLGGDLVICVDNVQHPLESDSMCTILTSEYWQERLLGSNTNAQIPTNSTFIFTGNNLTFVGDLCSRVVMCNIDPKVERPGERIFDRDLREYAFKHRDELVVAILTIIRAYIVAGYPEQGIPSFRLFTDWTRWIRSPLVWLGMKDPYESTRLITDNDPIRARLGLLFSTWHRITTDPLSIKQLLEIVNNPNRRAESEDIQALHAQLLEFAPDNKKEISPEKLGNRIRQSKGRTVKGFRLVASGEDRRGAMMWRIEKA